MSGRRRPNSSAPKIPTRTTCAPSRKAWRAWLRANHKTATEVWLVFLKRHVGRPCVAFDEALEEALCFGWIDTRVRRIDADRYAHRFTPRKPGSTWSSLNIARMDKMIAANKVTAAGRAAYAGHESRIAAPHPTWLSPDLQRVFKAASRAWTNFGCFPPGYRRMAIGWVASAKRQETQRRRLERLIEVSTRAERLEFI